MKSFARLSFLLGVSVCACSNSSSTTNTTPLEDASTAQDAAVLTDATLPTLDSSVTLDSSTDASDDAATLTDAQIVGIVETLNLGEIQESYLAIGVPADGGADLFDAGPARSTNADVINFANTMIAAHSQSDVDVAAIGVLPMGGPLEQALQVKTTTTLGQLSPLSGSTFDVAYAQAQVAAHQDAEAVVTYQLIPSVQNAALKTYLTGTLLPAIQQHLAMASMLVADLTDGGASDGGLPVEGGMDAGD